MWFTPVQIVIGAIGKKPKIEEETLQKEMKQRWGKIDYFSDSLC